MVRRACSIPSALTIGFARRFATYKRATLLLSQPERLQRAAAVDASRPVQFVFAGKAHPADDAGKEMIRQIVAFAADLDVRHRFVFLEDYDIAVARTLYQGADVWLNTPRRPQEACGTSGMKAALNGALNCSILDGWWDELFDGENGWAISSAESTRGPRASATRSRPTRCSTCSSTRSCPLFYDRFGGPVPRRWVAQGQGERWPRSARRWWPPAWSRDYVAGAVRADRGPGRPRARDDHWAGARALAAWKRRVPAPWDGVKVEAVETGDDGRRARRRPGASRRWSTSASLGAGRRRGAARARTGRPERRADRATVSPMTAATDPTPEADGGAARYDGAFTCDRPGRYGFTVRVVPCHPDLANPVELGRIAWAV